jgi:hypothetical protein
VEWRSICGCTPKASLAAMPVLWIIRRNQDVVTGVPASVTKTYGLDPCNGLNARSSGPCNGWTLSCPPLALFTCSAHASDQSAPTEGSIALAPVAHACKPVRSLQHPYRHSCLAFAQPLSADQPRSPLNTLVSDTPSLAFAVVFGFLLLG